MEGDGWCWLRMRRHKRAGLRLGMPATKAQALVPGLIVNSADPAADAEAIDRLALCALRLYAPIVAAECT
jgi:protein ImuB